MASCGDTPQQLLQEYIRRLAKVKQNPTLNPIAEVASSACGTLLGLADDKAESLLTFKANVMNVASWIIFFEEKLKYRDKNIAKKIRKAGKLYSCLKEGGRKVVGTKTTPRSSIIRNIRTRSVHDVNNILSHRLEQFRGWCGEEYEEWRKITPKLSAGDKAPTVPQPKEDNEVIPDDEVIPETQPVEPGVEQGAQQSNPRSGEASNRREAHDHVPQPKRDDEVNPNTQPFEQGAQPDNPRSGEAGNRRAAHDHVTRASELTQQTETSEDSDSDKGTSQPSALPDDPSSPPDSIKLPSVSALSSYGDSSSLNQSDPSLNYMLTPAASGGSTSTVNPTTEEDSLVDLNIDDDQEYDFLIYHEDDDEQAVISLRNDLQKNVKDKRGNTARVTIPSDFHYEGLKPKPLAAAVKKSTVAAFYISERTKIMERQDSLISSLDLLITTAKDTSVKSIIVLTKGGVKEAEELLKKDHLYVRKAASGGGIYDATASDFFEKMSQVFRKHRPATEERGRKSETQSNRSVQCDLSGKEDTDVKTTRSNKPLAIVSPTHDTPDGNHSVASKHTVVKSSNLARKGSAVQETRVPRGGLQVV